MAVHKSGTFVPKRPTQVGQHRELITSRASSVTSVDDHLPHPLVSLPIPRLATHSVSGAFVTM